MRKILRIIVAIIVGLPTLWCLYLAFTIMGLLLFVPLAGIILYPFNLMLDNKDSLYDNKQDIIAGGYMLIAPWLFWWHFIQGRNPFKEMGI